MLQKRVITVSFLCAFFFLLSSCGPKSNNQQKYGFKVESSECVGDSGALPYNVCLSGPRQIIPNIPISGSNPKDTLDVFGDDVSHGSVTHFGFTVSGDPAVSTDKNGNEIIPDGRVPASWDIYSLMPWQCGTKDYIGQLYYDGVDWMEYKITAYPLENYYQYPVSGTVSVNCFHYGALPAASTRFAVLGSLPNTLTLTSEAPLTTQSGMPLLYVYDGTESVVATETATSVSSDGTQATFPFPSTLPQNGYSLALVNKTGGNPGFSPAGTNLLSIASSQTIPGNPFGVAVAAQTSVLQECLYVRTVWMCNSTTSSSRSPVVTLYSTNQVLIGTATLDVGLNPTAVATYSSNPVTRTVTKGGIRNITTTSGNTRAIVANSGSNTISVLDIVNDARLFDVTVGNQPVALAVSSDGKIAYVANYTDGTVTQVNLTAGTVTATIAVGGHPTSVALTSAGILWVGGSGFLTELHASPMSIMATEAVAGKAIIALGYSNSVNQLVATTVDTRGNVFAEDVSPSTFHAGGVYTPLASHTVSSLGTRLNRVTGAQVQAFTQTLAGTSTINSNQVGAPPLVVQDGWAVVTATPTGFTITDITGHVVLVSETTPSPITGIAVDSKLNVAYLVMPDSNTLLTVPLPGTD